MNEKTLLKIQTEKHHLNNAIESASNDLKFTIAELEKFTNNQIEIQSGNMELTKM